MPVSCTLMKIQFTLLVLFVLIFFKKERMGSLQLTLKISVHFFSKCFLMLWPARPMSESSSLNVSQLLNTSLTSTAKASRFGYLKEQRGALLDYRRKGETESNAQG